MTKTEIIESEGTKMDETCKRVRRLTTKMVRTGKEILRLRKAIEAMTGADQDEARASLAKMVTLQRRRISTIISLLESMGIERVPRGDGELVSPTSDDVYAVYRTVDPSGSREVEWCRI